MPANTHGAAPDAPLADLTAPIYQSLADWRAETIGRLLFDAARAVERWAPKSMNRADREALAQDAVILLLRWTVSGDLTAPEEAQRYVIDCGAEGCAPSREVWRSRDDWRAPSNAAWILLHRAILQALKAPLILGWRRPDPETGAPKEEPTDPAELDRMAEEAPDTVTALGAAHARGDASEAATYSPIPDGVAIVDLAEAGEIPVNAARALAYQSSGLSPAEAGAAWGMSEAMVRKSASVGAAWLREHYPDTDDLAEILRRASRTLRARRREELAEALETGADATDALTRYRESCRAAAPGIVALEVAARNGAKRAGETAPDPGATVRLVDRAVARAKRDEYDRLAQAISTPVRGAALETAPVLLPTSEIVARWLKAPTRARAETQEETQTRTVRYVPEVKRRRRAKRAA